MSNLTISFLEVPILTRQSNKEPSQPTAACRQLEFWLVAKLTVSSRGLQYANRNLAWRTYVSILTACHSLEKVALDYYSCAARQNLRGKEQHTGWGTWGVPKNSLGPLFVGTDNRARARAHCQTPNERQEAACWGGPQGVTKKQPWTAIRGTDNQVQTRMRWQTKIEGQGASRWRGPLGRPQKRPWTAIRVRHATNKDVGI